MIYNVWNIILVESYDENYSSRNAEALATMTDRNLGSEASFSNSERDGQTKSTRHSTLQG